MKKLFLFFFLSALTLQFAQSADWIKQNYVKKEYRIPMRDGATLFTAVYSPKDYSTKHPIILFRTPYAVGPYGEDQFDYFPRWGVSQKLVEDLCIFVAQDVRGRFMSEGDYVNMRPHIDEKKSNKNIDENSDTYDTIDWLIKNIKNHNGKVGMLGNSYPGFYSAMAAINSHPALVAVSPQAPIADWFVGDDVHHNGAFCLLQSFMFDQWMDQARPAPTKIWPQPFEYPSSDAYSFYLELGPLSNSNTKYFRHRLGFWDEIFEHGTYDKFWQTKDILPHLNNVKSAVMTVGGWFDSEDSYGHLHIYKSIEEKNPGIKNSIVIGPWIHGGWFRTKGDSLGDISFGSETSKFYQENILTPFFEYYLFGKGQLDLPEAYVFGTGVNKWFKYDQWPPKNTIQKTLYLNADEKLSITKPTIKVSNSFDEYISDPKRPVPYSAKIHDSRLSYYKAYVIEDQRFASYRPDVLLYETEPLEKDITIVGTLNADLFVSTSGTDSDWIVKLIDVFPDDSTDFNHITAATEMGNYQMLVRYEMMRGKFRNSLEKPEPFIPNKVTEVKFEMNSVHHTFQKGHKIMIHVQSSFFPFFDMNPQTFCDIYKATEKDFKKATERVYHSAKYPSAIQIKVLN
jgi:uncharacterized protein